MIAVVATLTVKDGAQAEFEAAAAALVGAVKANEPGCVLYTVTKSRSDPTVYVAMELYNTADDLAAHGGSAAFKALAPALGATLAGKPVIAVHDVIA
jgi:quinol monooxygenase YgiN